MIQSREMDGAYSTHGNVIAHHISRKTLSREIILRLSLRKQVVRMWAIFVLHRWVQLRALCVRSVFCDRRGIDCLFELHRFTEWGNVFVYMENKINVRKPCFGLHFPVIDLPYSFWSFSCACQGSEIHFDEDFGPCSISFSDGGEQLWNCFSKPEDCTSHMGANSGLGGGNLATDSLSCGKACDCDTSCGWERVWCSVSWLKS